MLGTPSHTGNFFALQMQIIFQKNRRLIPYRLGFMHKSAQYKSPKCEIIYVSDTHTHKTGKHTIWGRCVPETLARARVTGRRCCGPTLVAHSDCGLYVEKAWNDTLETQWMIWSRILLPNRNSCWLGAPPLYLNSNVVCH
jgi:hypothetical protein